MHYNYQHNRYILYIILKNYDSQACTSTNRSIVSILSLLRHILSPVVIKIVLELVDVFCIDDTFWETVPGFCRSLEEEVCLDSSRAVLGWSHVELEFVLSAGACLGVEGCGCCFPVVEMKMFIHFNHIPSSPSVGECW